MEIDAAAIHLPPMARFAIVMFLILATPYAARRLRIPAVVGYILVGILIGPHVLSVLPEQLMAAPAVKVAGEVPASLALRIDFTAGVLTKAQNPVLAQEFLNYLTSPEAQSVWKSGGVAVPSP